MTSGYIICTTCPVVAIFSSFLIRVHDLARIWSAAIPSALLFLRRDQFYLKWVFAADFLDPTKSIRQTLNN